MIGRHSLLSKVVSIFAPKGASTVAETWAWMSPSAPHWAYIPHKGPWTLIRCSIDEEHLYGHERHRKFEDVMLSFAVLHLPRRGERCIIVDDHHQIAIGWEDPNDDGRFGWTGCKFSFEILGLLTEFVDPNAVVAWEAAAKYRHDEFGGGL